MGYLHLTEEDIRIENRLLTSYLHALSALPAGRLTYKTMRGRIYYYHIDEATGAQHYINKGNQNLIYDLKYKRLLEESITVLKQNLKYQSKLLKNYQPYDPNAIQNKLPQTYSDIVLSEYYQCLDHEPETQPSDELEDFGLKHRTSFGLYVRSKSEIVIAELLHGAGIPFIYESPLKIYDEAGVLHKYKPDFKIKAPLGVIKYWEHLGMLHIEKYRNKAFKKITDYHYNNIIVPDNLIITMDSPGGMIDITSIDRIIKGQLLPLFQ